jgi:L-asparaginase
MKANSIPMADEAKVRVLRVDGVVITHGTDTLEETAFLLDLVLDSEKPIVFAGAMRNSSELGWDGPVNLRSAGSSAVRGLGVLVAMDDQILAAAEATKSHTDARETFQSRDSGPLGHVEADRVRIVHRPAAREHIVASRLEERIEIIKLASGSDGQLLRCAIESGIRGIVIEGLGCGNVPVTAIPDMGEQFCLSGPDRNIFLEVNAPARNDMDVLG